MRETGLLRPGVNGIVGFFHDRTGLAEFHSHPELEFNLATAGSAFYIVDSRRYLLTPGTLIWLFPAQEHLLVDVSSDFTMWIGVLSAEVASSVGRERGYEALARDHPGEVLVRRLRSPAADELSRLAALVHGARAGSTIARFNHGVAYLFLEAWEAFVHGADLDGASDLSPVVAGVLRQVAATGGCLRLGEAAEQFRVTPSWLSRTFHREAGVRFVDYCNRLKLMRFEELRAAHTAANLTALALDAGFGSYAQFYRVFRAAHGRGPAAHAHRAPAE